MPLSRRQVLPKFTDRLQVGTSGLSVSPFCQGYAKDPEIIAALYEAGINFFFVTADMHWPAYEGIRKGLQLLLASGCPRESIVVAGVSYMAQPEFSFAPFQELVDAIPGLGHLDMTVMGGCYPEEFLTRQRVYTSHLAGAVKGVRSISASFHDRHTAMLAVNGGLVDVAFIRYNTGHPGAESDVLPHLHSDRPEPRSLLYSFTTNMGHVTPTRLRQLNVPEDKWQPRLTDHYRRTLSLEGFDGLLVALQTREHIAELAAALEEGPVTEEEAEYMVDLSSLHLGALEMDP